MNKLNLVLKKIGESPETREPGNYTTDFTQYEYECMNNWVMYVYEVQHHSGLNPISNSDISGSLPWSNIKYQTPPKERKNAY